MTTTMQDAVGGLRERLAEHARRLEADPEYRAEHERKRAEEARRDEEEQRAAWDAARARARLERITQNRVAWGMPPRVIAMLGSVSDTDAVLRAREFMVEQDPRTLLVLSGGPGCGKTVAACVALDAATPLDAPRFRLAGRFVKAIELVRAGTFDGAFWDSLQDASVLVIDDLGTEPLDEKGWALANLAALLDGRYDSLRKTVITTNLPLAKFKERYCTADGGRLYDRLREAGAYVELAGKSMRTPVAAAPKEPQP